MLLFSRKLVENCKFEELEFIKIVLYLFVENKNLLNVCISVCNVCLKDELTWQRFIASAFPGHVGSNDTETNLQVNYCLS